jgi:hypothetical protein
MKRLSMVLLGAGLLAARCHGQDGSAGSQENQSCQPALVQSVSEQLKLPGPIGAETGSDSNTSTVIAAACKSNPADRKQTYVALAYDAGDQDGKRLLLAIVEGDRVVADYRDEIYEDASLTLQSDSLHIDTARYVLANGVRAFGLDVSGWASPNCGDGGGGATRSLYIREGAHIRRVLADMGLSSWRYLQEGNDRCNSSAPVDTPTIVENTRYTLRVLPETSHGFHDLQVTATITRNDGKPGGDGGRYVLKYDGKRYPVPGGL